MTTKTKTTNTAADPRAAYLKTAATVIDLAQENVNGAFDLARAMLGAKDARAALEAQNAFFQTASERNIKAAQKIGEATRKAFEDAAQPVRDQVAEVVNRVRGNAA